LALFDDYSPPTFRTTLATLTREELRCTEVEILNCWQTNSMEKIPLEKMTGRQMVKKFPPFIPKVHYSVYNSQPMFRIPSQMNPVHILTSHMLSSSVSTSYRMPRSAFPFCTALQFSCDSQRTDNPLSFE
jgi:hypothetical protein